MSKLYPMPSPRGTNHERLFVSFPVANPVAAYDAIGGLPQNVTTTPNSSGAGATSQGEPDDRLLTLMGQIRKSMAPADWQEFAGLLSQKLHEAGGNVATDDDALADQNGLPKNASLKTNPNSNGLAGTSNTRAARGASSPEAYQQVFSNPRGMASRQTPAPAMDAFRRRAKADFDRLEQESAYRHTFDVKIAADDKYGMPVSPPKRVSSSAAASYGEMFPDANRLKKPAY